MTGSSFFINILNYLFNSFVGRSLGPEGLSEIAALFSYLAIFTIPITIVSLVIIQRIASAESPEKYTLSIEKIFVRIIKLYWWIGVVVLLFSPFIPKLTNLSYISAAAFFPILALTYYFGLYQAFLQGLQLFTAFSIIGLIITSIKFTGAVIIVLTPYGYGVVFVFFAASLLAGSILSYRAVRNKCAAKMKANIGSTAMSFRAFFQNEQFVITSVSTIALTFFNNIDVVFVKKFLDAEASGLYNSWSIFAKIIYYVFGPLIALSFVYFSRGKKNTRQDIVLLYSLGGIAVFGAVAYFIYLNFAPLLINIVFGKKFMAIAPILGTASAFGILYSAVMYMNSYFLARRSRYGLILPVIMPFYIIALLTAPKNIDAYVRVNIVNISVIAALYLFAALRAVFFKKNG